VVCYRRGLRGWCRVGLGQVDATVVVAGTVATGRAATSVTGRAGAGGAVTPTTTKATKKKTGAITSEASDNLPFVARPFRLRRTATIAGTMAARHSSSPAGAVAGTIAAAAPSATTPAVTVPSLSSSRHHDQLLRCRR
jgi:hypothetical protein